MFNSDRTLSLTGCLLIVLLSVTAYMNTLENDFAFDDRAMVVHNELIRKTSNIPLFFVKSHWTSRIQEEWDKREHRGGFLYRPLTLSSLSLNYAFGGTRTFGYHLANIGLHTLVSLLAFALARALGCSGAASLLAGVLFAIHPIHTEAVAMVSIGRAELLMSFGFLLALLLYVRGRTVRWGRPWFFFISNFAFAFSLASKEQAVTLPGILVLYDILAWKRQDKAWLRGAAGRYSTYLVVLFGYLLLRLDLFKKMAHYQLATVVHRIDNPLAHVDWFERILTALWVSAKYLWLTIWPENLSFDYSYNAIPVVSSLADLRVFAAAGAWGFLSALALWSYFRGRGTAFFGIGFTVITFLPTSNLIVPIGTTMGERLFYLPLFGLALVAAAAWDHVHETVANRRYAPWAKPAAVVMATALALCLMARTIIRNRDWRNNATLFQSALAVVPESAKVRFNLGFWTADPYQTLAQIAEARRIAPFHYNDANEDVNLALGSAFLALDRLAEAEEAFRRAVVLGSTNLVVHYHLGLTYSRQGRTQEAERSYQKALELSRKPLDSSSLELLPNLGSALLGLGKLAEGTEALERAVAQGYNDPTTYYLLGVAHTRQGNWENAAAAYREALRLKPEHADASNNLSFVLWEQGRFESALAAAADAVRLRPRFAEGLINKARALESLGRFKESLEAYERALAIKPSPALRSKTDALKTRPDLRGESLPP